MTRVPTLLADFYMESMRPVKKETYREKFVIFLKKLIERIEKK